MTDKNEIKEKELEEISGGLIPPYPPSASIDKNGVMTVNFASETDKEDISSKSDNTGGICG